MLMMNRMKKMNMNTSHRFEIERHHSELPDIIVADTLVTEGVVYLYRDGLELAVPERDIRRSRQ